jgi:hypothetical protein
MTRRIAVEANQFPIRTVAGVWACTDAIAWRFLPALQVLHWLQLGLRCQTLGPSRSSITARMGVPRSRMSKICAATSSATKGSPVMVCNQRHVPHLHDEVRCDGWNDVILSPDPLQRQGDKVGAVGVNDAVGIRITGIDSTVQGPRSCWPCHHRFGHRWHPRGPGAKAQGCPNKHHWA